MTAPHSVARAGVAIAGAALGIASVVVARRHPDVSLAGDAPWASAAQLLAGWGLVAAGLAHWARRPATRIPMTTFDKREEGFEKQFAHNEELRFKATARRNKLLGLWAASKLGLSGAEADAYAKAVVAADFEEVGDHDVFRKVRGDLDAKKVAGVSDQELRKTMDELLARAVEEIKAGR